MNKTYDVALSFAGEDRYYVKQVAGILRDAGITVFYDEFEESALWGKNLYTYLRHIYRDQARYTVFLCSECYAKKLWTNHERESAQERAFKETSEYILPARFDDTEIPGLPGTIAYVDLREKTPYELSLLIGEKVNKPIELINQQRESLQEAVDRIIAEEDALSSQEIENRNRHWDKFQHYLESIDKTRLFEHQRKNNVFLLRRRGLTAMDVKRHLMALGYYEGAIDNDFNYEFVEAVTRFQQHTNMRHVDGIVGELTLAKIQEKLAHKSRRRHT